MVKYFLKKDTDKLAKNIESKEIIKKWIKKIEVLDNEIIIHFTLDGNSPIRLVAGDGFRTPRPSGYELT